VARKGKPQKKGLVQRYIESRVKKALKKNAKSVAQQAARREYYRAVNGSEVRSPHELKILKKLAGL
jgi:hypothetical protein